MLKDLPKVYVLGSTNAGKSSVINAMLAAQNKKKYKKKQLLLRLGMHQKFLWVMDQEITKVYLV